MTTPASFSEEECFSVFWKIKKFTYYCETIRSPEFSFHGSSYFILLNMASVHVDCTLQSLPNFHQRPGNDFRREISFLTCDRSPKESISGGKSVNLRVPKDVIFGSRRNSFLPGDALTVRFRFPTTYERGKLYICSQIGVKRNCFLWTLKNFSNYQYDPKCFNQYNMKKYVEKSEDYGDIELALKPMGGFNTDKNFSIEISRTGENKCYCILKIYVLDVDGRALNCVSDEFVFETYQQTRMFPSLIKKNKLLSCKNLLLPNDTLSLKCDFALSLGKVTDETSVISYSEDVASLVKEFDYLPTCLKVESGSDTDLKTDLKSILDSGTLFDVSLQIGSEVIRAHKNILSARSPVFRAMFTKDMQEATNNTVAIEDLSVETVLKLLLYMYTDTIHDCQWENLKELYFASDKYEVLSLKKKCVPLMKTNLSISNVCDALVLSDLHQDRDLKTAAIDFISEYDSAFFASEEWKELEKNNSSLAFKFMREICCNKQTRLN
ncbi:TD and POZ domain-containing protein 1-like [Araneus ventricosus]|uniref:TD and POZ domain-containing protein 1-like n=1 Tax=Araneus ventricosus TaxID=182803 RepID=A0A4Y2P9Q6_ARAVE|nr:TD and POZ domain-containing protein 1-like [Araneus ventricosus]GBN47782.1 TD and POZ domain-containing protein 1-like [Araneus ventricosus]